jgi:dTDP-4-amino-4,6-dideoxygalactose transaminase
MPRLCEIARSHGLAIVEDACQVPGATVQGRAAGSWGDVSVLSFGGSKLLTAGRGGAVLTQRADIAQRIKIYCERGNHAFPLSELQAAVLPPQIARLSDRNRQRQTSVQRLVEHWPADSPLEPVIDQAVGHVPSYYKLSFRYHAERCGGWPREQFLAAVQAEGVPCDSGFRGFVKRGSARCRRVGSLDASRLAAEQVVLLHHPILLGPASAIELLAAAVDKVARHASRGSRG